MKTKTWNISSTSRTKLDDVETTVRKYPTEPDIGAAVKLVLKNSESGAAKTCDSDTYYVYAAIWRDSFDEATGKALYVLYRKDTDSKKADEIVERHLAEGAHDAGEPFDAPTMQPEDADAAPAGAESKTDEGDACRALVPAKKRGGEVVVPEVVDPDTGCRVDNGDFKLSSGPTPAEMRKAVIEEIEGAEKGVSSARSRMKKLALQIADLCAGSLPCGDAVTDYKIAQGEWMSETSALAGAQQRLRDLDAEIAEGKLS